MEGVILIDVLRRAGVEVVSAALQEGPITAARGTRHLADALIADVNAGDFDMMVLPGGGPGAKNLQADTRVGALLREMKEKDRYIGAICAAPNVLRNLGILEKNDPFVCFPGTETTGQGGEYRPGERIVKSGKVLTSVGPGSAFEFALELVEILCGREAREKVQGPLQLPA